MSHLSKEDPSGAGSNKVKKSVASKCFDSEESFSVVGPSRRCLSILLPGEHRLSSKTDGQ